MRTLEVLKEANNDQLVEMIDIYDEHGSAVHTFISSNLGLQNLVKHFLSSDEFAKLSTERKWQVLENFEQIQHFISEFDRIAGVHKMGAYNRDQNEMKAVS